MCRVKWWPGPITRQEEEELRSKVTSRHNKGEANKREVAFFRTDTNTNIDRTSVRHSLSLWDGKDDLLHVHIGKQMTSRDPLVNRIEEEEGTLRTVIGTHANIGAAAIISFPLEWMRFFVCLKKKSVVNKTKQKKKKTKMLAHCEYFFFFPAMDIPHIFYMSSRLWVYILILDHSHPPFVTLIALLHIFYY